MNDKIISEATKFMDKYSKYLPANKEIHESFGEDLGNLCASAFNSGIDQIEGSLMKTFKK